MKKTHVPCSLKIEEEAVRYDLDNPTKRNTAKLLQLFLTALGYFGSVLVICDLYGTNIRKGIFLPLAIGGFLLASLLQFLPKHSGKLTLGFILVLLGMSALFSKQIVLGFHAIFNVVYQTAHNTNIAYFQIAKGANITFAATLTGTLVAELLAFLFAFFTIRKPHFTLPTAVSFLLAEPGLYLGIPVSVPAMGLLLAYWGGMLALRFPALWGREKIRCTQRTSAIGGSLTALLILLVYGTVSLTGTWQGYSRPESDKLRRQEISESLADFDIQNLPQSIRKIAAAIGMGNNQTVTLGNTAKQRIYDRTDLKLTLDDLPESTMYLKSYTGSTYGKNCWDTLASDTEAVNSDMVFPILESYDCNPQNFPFLFQQTSEPDSGTYHCTITPQRRDGRYYQPYAAFSSDVSYLEDVDFRPKNRDSYDWTAAQLPPEILSVLSQQEPTSISFNSSWSNDAVRSFMDILHVPSNGSDVTISTRFSANQIAAAPDGVRGKVIPAAFLESVAYRDFAADVYTRLPESEALDAVYAAMPESLQNAHPQTTQERYAALCEIRAWLSEQAEYDLAPGKTPRNRDYVNFFLLENHKGYCMHFATAGTILARHLGIPARYCEGYLVDSEVLNSASIRDGRYVVNVPNKKAHAWCEFYIDGYGWLPFEMTPGYTAELQPDSDTEEVPSEPSTETTVDTTPENNTSATPEEMTSAALTSTEISGSMAAPKDNTIAGSKPTDGSIPGFAAVAVRLLIWAICIGLFIGAAVLLRLLHVRYRQNVFLDTRHPRKAVHAMYRYLFRLLRWTGLRFRQEPLLEFCEKAVQHLRQQKLPATAPEQIIPMILAMEFGKQDPEKAEQRQAAAEASALADAIFKRCNPLKRFCMKYLLHLI